VPFVHRVTSVTVVTLLALAGPGLTSGAVASPSVERGAHAPAAEHRASAGRPKQHHPKKKKHKKKHHKKLTAKQRYYKWHPRLIRAARTAVHQRGDRYRWGAEGPRRFDCSGLVYYAYRRAGFGDLPRTSRQQYHYVRHIKRANLARGDLMFFRAHGRVYHVAVFLYWKDGRRVFIHSPNSRGRVRKAVPWNRHWRAGTLRPLHQRHRHHR
jgi:cell wall-associated NlpC family hydrolase